MSQNHFAAVPNISIPRSRFKMPFNHSTSWLHGDLIPLDCFEVIAGDTISCKLSAMVWMSTPIAPIFGNIKGYLKAFFVPMRLIWEHWEEFFGANKTNAGYQTVQRTVPMASLSVGINDHSVSAYLGKPQVATNGCNVSVSVLKERGYYLIWNEYYRAQQVQNPVLIDFSDTGNIGSLNGNTISFARAPLKVNKMFDYFTACTLYPQYGAAVTLPLGTYATVKTIPVTDVNTSLLSTNPMFWATSAGGVVSLDGASSPHSLLETTNGATFRRTGSETLPSGTDVNLFPANLVADLSNATAATINSLRYAFAVQKYLERANFGSRYYEILSVHYGVTSPDSRLQIPERLGSCEMPINISSVLSTAGYAAGNTTTVGAPGAAATAALRQKHLFTKAFVEPGYVYVMLGTHHERSYVDGILREDLKADRFDFYSPEFANLGDQVVYDGEIYCGGLNNTTAKAPFGYQEHWAEYRYRPNRVSGLLAPTGSNSLAFWTLADKFAAVPSLSGTFLEEDRNAISRALVSGNNGPDYIGDFYFDYTATREMPLITIPGLIDHFGSM